MKEEKTGVTQRRPVVAATIVLLAILLGIAVASFVKARNATCENHVINAIRQRELERREQDQASRGLQVDAVP